MNPKLVPGDRTAKVYGLAPSDYAEAVCSLYHRGLRQGNRSGLWDDAEQFLAKLDEAAEDPRGTLARVIRDDLLTLKNKYDERDKDAERAAAMLLANTAVKSRALLDEAIRFVAAAATLFLERAERNPAVVKSGETWAPYRRWLRELQPGDSVISFNYDRALNLLEACCRSGIFIQPAIELDDDLIRASSASCVRLYHLHGQVGWRRDGDSIVDAGAPVAHEDPQSAVLGVPGDGKQGLATSLLRRSWRGALITSRTRRPSSSWGIGSLRRTTTQQRPSFPR